MFLPLHDVLVLRVLTRGIAPAKLSKPPKLQTCKPPNPQAYPFPYSSNTNPPSLQTLTTLSIRPSNPHRYIPSNPLFNSTHRHTWKDTHAPTTPSPHPLKPPQAHPPVHHSRFPSRYQEKPLNRHKDTQTPAFPTRGTLALPNSLYSSGTEHAEPNTATRDIWSPTPYRARKTKIGMRAGRGTVARE